MTTKDILVVGGAGGVGSALVKLLMDRGFRVVVTVLNLEEVSLIESRFGGMVQCHVVDLSNAEAVLIKMKEIASTINYLEAVAVCAAVAPVGPMELTPL